MIDPNTNAALVAHLVPEKDFGDETLYRIEYLGELIRFPRTNSEWPSRKGAKMALNSHVRCSLERGFYTPCMKEDEIERAIKEIWSSGEVKIVEYKKVRA